MWRGSSGFAHEMDQNHSVLHRPILPWPPIVIVGGVPEALLDRLEVRQRRHRRRCRLASDGLGERPLGTQVGRSQRRVHHALQAGLVAGFNVG